MELRLLKKDHWFAIAKIVDNDFIGKDKTFDVLYRNGYYRLDSGVCDSCSIIRFYPDGKITLINDDTRGYVEVMPQTYERVNNYLKTINNAPPTNPPI